MEWTKDGLGVLEEVSDPVLGVSFSATDGGWHGLASFGLVIGDRAFPLAYRQDQHLDFRFHHLVDQAIAYAAEFDLIAIRVAMQLSGRDAWVH
jgi:hypothetical protein